MNNLDKSYQSLLQDILDNGYTKSDRTGTGTLSIFGRQIRHNMSEGFPLLTTKKMAWKQIVTELLWFLRGDTNIKYLVDNNCHIWDGDAYKNYLKHTITGVENGLDRIKGHLDNCLVEFEGSYEHFTNPSFAYGFRPHTQEEFINKIKTDDEFAYKWGNLGPVYGKQWRSWDAHNKWDIDPEPIDQIANLINDLKTNPDSRRLMVNAYNIGELDTMVLPPCHYGFQVYTRELSEDERYDLCAAQKSKMTAISEEDYIKYNIPTRAISLMWNQRSADAFLGIPFNIASYGLLLEIIAKEVNMVPDELIGNLGDTHLYLNHIEQAKEQIGRELTLEERRELVSQDEFNKVYTGGSPETLSHSEIDQFGVPRRTREPFGLPQLRVSSGILDDISHHEITDFDLLNYQSHPTIKAPLSN